VITPGSEDKVKPLDNTLNVKYSNDEGTKADSSALIKSNSFAIINSQDEISRRMSMESMNKKSRFGKKKNSSQN